MLGSPQGWEKMYKSNARHQRRCNYAYNWYVMTFILEMPLRASSSAKQQQNGQWAHRPTVALR